MSDTRCKNSSWKMNIPSNGKILKSDAQLAVLMDRRDELQTLNRVFTCHYFVAIPQVLRRISVGPTRLTTPVAGEW